LRGKSAGGSTVGTPCQRPSPPLRPWVNWRAEAEMHHTADGPRDEARYGPKSSENRSGEYCRRSMRRLAYSPFRTGPRGKPGASKRPRELHVPASRISVPSLSWICQDVRDRLHTGQTAKETGYYRTRLPEARSGPPPDSRTRGQRRGSVTQPDEPLKYRPVLGVGRRESPVGRVTCKSGRRRVADTLCAGGHSGSFRLRHLWDTGF